METRESTWLTVPEAARELQIPCTRCHELIERGELPAVRRKTRRAYRGYVIETRRHGRCDFNMPGFYARTNAKGTKRGMEIAYAYLQLGSCIIQGIPPIP